MICIDLASRIYLIEIEFLDSFALKMGPWKYYHKDYFVLEVFFLTSLSFVPQSGSLCTFSTFHKFILISLPLSTFFQFSQLFSCDYLWVSIYQVRQRHIHRQPDAFDYCYLQKGPELCIAWFGNLFLYIEFCVFLHHNPFLFCLRISSCIFRPCHSLVEKSARCAWKGQTPI